MDEHGLGTVEIVIDQVRVEPGVTCPSSRGNGFPVVAILSIHEKLGGAQYRWDAMPWKAVLSTDLPTLKGMVAGDKILA